MKKRIGLLLVLAVAACEPPPPSPCVNPGVDIEHPNFYTTYDYHALERYYGCVYQNAAGRYSDDPFRTYRWSSSPEYLRQDSQYQWNLWRQLYTHMKPALEIEQLWLQYYNAQLLMRAQLNATREAAYQAERSADASDREYYDRKSHERKAKKESQEAEKFRNDAEKVKAMPSVDLKPYVPLVAPAAPAP